MRRVAGFFVVLLGCTPSSDLRTTDASTTDGADYTQCSGPLPTTCIFGTVPCPPTLDAARAPNALCGASRWITQDECGGYTVVEAWGKDTSTALFYDADGLLAGVAGVSVNFGGSVRCLGSVPGFTLPLVPERNRLDCPVGTMVPACVDAGAAGD